MTRYDPKVYDPENCWMGMPRGWRGSRFAGRWFSTGSMRWRKTGRRVIVSPCLTCCTVRLLKNISHRIADLLDAERFELTVSLMEADPERYAVD